MGHFPQLSYFLFSAERPLKDFQRMKLFGFLHITSPSWHTLLKTQFWQKSFGLFIILKMFPFSLQKLFFLPQNSTFLLHSECTTGAEYLFSIYTILSPHSGAPPHYPHLPSKINMAHYIPQLRPDLN